MEFNDIDLKSKNPNIFWKNMKKINHCDTAHSCCCRKHIFDFHMHRPDVTRGCNQIGLDKRLLEALGKDCTGKIAYIGSTQFAQGKWIGEKRSGYLTFCVAMP